MAIIEVSNVVKVFDGVLALGGVTLNVAEGAIYGLAGPNGSGKSTLIRHIAGIYQPDEGTVRIDGRDPYKDAPIRAKVACVYDEPFAYSQATIRDLVRLCRQIYPQFSDDYFSYLRDSFPDINERSALRRMSRGMRKQAALWIALSCRPAVLLLDEPLDGLDPFVRSRAWGLIQTDVVQHKMTVLLSSHNLRELEGMCHVIGFISRGCVVSECSAEGLSGVQIESIFMQLLGGGPNDAESV